MCDEGYSESGVAHGCLNKRPSTRNKRHN